MYTSSRENVGSVFCPAVEFSCPCYLPDAETAAAFQREGVAFYPVLALMEPVDKIEAVYSFPR